MTEDRPGITGKVQRTYPTPGQRSEAIWRHVELRFSPEEWEWWMDEARSRGISMGDLISLYAQVNAVWWSNTGGRKTGEEAD